MSNNSHRVKGSFRDPSGFLFERDGVLYRQVNQRYRENYELLMSSGLYDQLIKAGQLVPHQEVDAAPEVVNLAFRVIQPERLAFISYPYEWSFSQLKDAALLTLKIQKKAIAAGMSLKDASAYNVQFRNGKPLLIDTLSFEAYPEGKPWIAYRQFCQHFLAPLALMSYRDVRLSQLLRIYIDGVPLDMASALLPLKARFNFGLLTHIYAHAQSQKKYSDQTAALNSDSRQVTRMGLLGILDSLENTVRGLRWQPGGTEWADYYDATNYTDDAFESKKKIISDFLDRIQPQMVWDLGANTGLFSRLASERGILTVASDIDPTAVEKDYLDIKKGKEKNLLPLVMDLTNPSPALGWHNQERASLTGRGPADAVMALALVHHLAISNNVPLPDLAGYFAELGRWLIVEFVPKSDSQVQRLLATREDIFDHYQREDFEAALSEYFELVEARDVPGSKRTLYCLKNRRDL